MVTDSLAEPQPINSFYAETPSGMLATSRVFFPSFLSFLLVVLIERGKKKISIKPVSLFFDCFHVWDMPFFKKIKCI